VRRRIFRGAAAVAGVSLLVGIVSAAVVGRTAQTGVRDDLVRQARATAALLEEELAGAPVVELTRRGRELLQVVQRIGGHDYVEAAVVTGRTVRPLTADPVLLPALPDEATERSFFEVDVGAERVFATAAVADIGSRLRLLIVLGRVEPVLAQRALIRPVVVALGIGLALAAVLAWWLARSVARRLDPLRDASAAIAAGDLSARAPVTGDDEIAAAAGAFNEMAAALAAARDREHDFLLSVGHDLRTPLTTIRGYAEALAAGDVPGEDLARVAGVLHAQADRLSRLVEDLMLLARLEAGEYRLRPEEVDLAAHVAGVAGEHRPAADAARVRLVVERRDEVRVVVDPDRIAQITSNLVENALRYTPEGGTVTVRVGRLEAGPGLEVADTGPGIDPVDLPRVFERLYVAQRYRAVRPEGSGLGLSIVDRLVRAMGGRVVVDSTPGSGTTVTVVFPSGGAPPQGS
jgi:two-component system, OmpR family, sensor kinase